MTTATATKKRVVPSTAAPKGKTIYLTSKDLREQVAISKAQGQMTDALARMLLLLISRFAQKPCYSGYNYNDDMQQYAMMMLCKTWDKYNEEKSANAFAFFTQCVKNSFNQYLNLEKRQRVIKDQERINQGLNPSFAFQSGLREVNFGDDEQDYHSYAHSPSDDVEKIYQPTAEEVESLREELTNSEELEKVVDEE